MYKAILKCRVITPMFMAGADGITPELRPSEFKGMMRFWWRAIKAEKDIEKLREEEAKIFGGSGEKESKSKVKINVYPQPDEKNKGSNIKEKIKNKEGLSYLLYSTFSLRSHGKTIIRSYIKPEFNFQIEITSFDEYAFKNALASLWTAIYLGGFGSRARRGGGNIEVIDSKEVLHILNFSLPLIKSREELKVELKNNLEKIFEIVKRGNDSNYCPYSNLKNSKIIILKPYNNWQDALNKIGELYKKFRTNNKSDVFNMGAFGMPIMHNGFKVRIVPYNEKNAKGETERLSERMASPLIIKLIKVQENYFPIIIKLSTILPLAGKEEKIEGIWRRASSKLKEINMSRIDEFLNFVKEQEREIEELSL